MALLDIEPVRKRETLDCRVVGDLTIAELFPFPNQLIAHPIKGPGRSNPASGEHGGWSLKASSDQISKVSHACNALRPNEVEICARGILSTDVSKSIWTSWIGCPDLAVYPVEYTVIINQVNLIETLWNPPTNKNEEPVLWSLKNASANQ